jgi:CRP/FNR family cyclic AMP-dependent transcriptional regulator
MSAIAPALPLIVIRTGSHAAVQGAPCTGLLVVRSGVLLSSCVTVDGRRLGELLGPGDAVGGPEGEPSPVSVRALRICRLRAALAHERPGLLHARASRAIALAHELAWLGVAARVERRLHETAIRFGAPVHGGRGLGVKLTQEDLAELAGTTRESVNRAINAMIAAGRLHMASRGRYVLPGVAAAS